MALVGAAQGFMVSLVGPIFDRVLNPDSPDSLVPLFKVPGFRHPIYLPDLVPSSIPNILTMAAVAMDGLFLVKGLCDYFGHYVVTYDGFSAVTNPRQKASDRVWRRDAHFC